MTLSLPGTAQQRAFFEDRAFGPYFWSGAAWLPSSRLGVLPTNDQVHLWCVPLIAESDCLSSLLTVLSAEEKKRASAFAFEKHRKEFIVSRGCLRQILSAYLDMEASAVDLVAGEKGKPALAPIMPHRDLRFNVSHAGRLAVYALAYGREIGVDVERILEIRDLVDIAHCFFSPAEYGELLTLRGPQRREAFFRCWTRKEAFIKAVGDGLSFPLDSFRVSLLGGHPPALLALDGVSNPQERWSMHSFCPAPGYVGAIVVEGMIRQFGVHSFANSEQTWTLPAVLATRGTMRDRRAIA